MFEKFINRYIPIALLPRRRTTEHLLRRAFLKEAGQSIDRFFENANMSEKEIKIFFDVVDERLGERMIADDVLVRVAAAKEAMHSLMEYVEGKPATEWS